MKGKIKLILFAVFLSFGALTGCSTALGGTGNEDNNSDTPSGGNGGDTPSPGPASIFDFTVDEAQNKLKQLGLTKGYEITLKGTGEDEETGRVEVDEITTGLKGDILWVKDEIALKNTSEGVEYYYPSEEKPNEYYYEATSNAVAFDKCVDEFTSMFYIAYQFESYLQKEGEISFLGRKATKYSFTGVYATAFANVEVIVDNELGITLKLAAAGADLDGKSASGYIEITSFKTGSEVLLPTLVAKGGDTPGPGPGEETDVYPEPGKYIIDMEMSTAWSKDMSKGSYFEILKDGTGTFYDRPDYLGETHYYTGTFKLVGLNIVMTTVLSVIDGGSSYATDGTVFEFAFVGDGYYAIRWEDGYLYYHLEGGETPNEALAKHIVSEQQYAANVTAMEYIQANTSATVSGTITSYGTIALYGQIENDHGVYFRKNTYPSTGQSNEDMYVPSTAQAGYYDYYYINNGEWVKSDYPIEMSLDYAIAPSTGLDVASLVPFEKLSAPTNVTSPYYTLKSFSYSEPDSDYTYEYSNIKMYFEEGKLWMFSYEMYGSVYQFTYSELGTTRVNIPTIVDNTPEKHNEYVANKQYAFKTINKNGYPGTQITDEIIQAAKIPVFKFFNDDTYELYSDSSALENGSLYVEIGTYELTTVANEKVGTIKLKPTASYTNGKLNNGNLEGTTLSYDRNSGDVMIVTGITYNGTHYDIEFVYSQKAGTPTHYEVPAAQTNWPAEDVADALQQLGIKMVLPAPKNDDKISSVDVNTVDGAVEVKVNWGSTSNVSNNYNAYTSALIEAGLTFVRETYDANTATYRALSPEGQYVVDVIWNLANDYFTIKVWVNDNSYPEEEINSYLHKINANASLPKFALEGSLVEFYSETGALNIAVPANYEPSRVAEQFKASLASSGYKGFRFVSQNYTSDIYVKDGVCVSVIVSEGNDHAVMVFIDEDRDNLESHYAYPTTTVEEATPEAVRDSVPNFVVDGCTAMYYFGSSETENTYQMLIVPEIGVGLDRLVRELGSACLQAGYTQTGSGKYVSENGDIIISIAKQDDAQIVITITFDEPVGLYPGDKLAKFAKENGYQDSLPELIFEGALYTYDEEMFSLFIEFAAGVDLQNAKDAIEVVLQQAGWLRGAYDYDEQTDFYVSPSLEYSVYINIYEGQINVGFVNGENTAEMFTNLSLTYPIEAINSTYPAGIRDSVPNLAEEGTLYTIETEEDYGFTLRYHLQPNQSSSTVAASIISKLLAAGFTASEDNVVFTSQHEQVTVIVDTSKTNAIELFVTYDYQVTDCLYSLEFDGDWNVFTDNPQMYAYVWDYAGNGKWVELVYDEESNAFLLDVDSTYIGCKVVRFSTGSNVAWEGEGVTIWNETEDIALSGDDSVTLHFVFKP